LDQIFVSHPVTNINISKPIQYQNQQMQPSSRIRRVCFIYAWCKSAVWICGGQSGTGTGFSPTSIVSPCQYYSTMALHIHISPGGWKIGPLVAAVQRHLLTPSIWTTTSLLFRYMQCIANQADMRAIKDWTLSMLHTL
jgi:hypothetical protein